MSNPIGPAETYNKNEKRVIPNSNSNSSLICLLCISLSLQDAIGKHTLESCAYLAQTMLSQSCTGLPDHQDAHFPAPPGGMAPPHYHHPGLGPMMQGHFGYGPHSQSPSMEAPEESAVSSSGIPYTPQPSPAKQQQQAEFQQAASPVKGGGGRVVPGSPAGSAYGSSPMRYPGTPPPPKDSGYILPSPAKQLFPSETGGNVGYPSSHYQSSYNGHQSDHNQHHQMQGYGYGHYQQSASGQPSSSTAAASYGNQYGNLV